MLNIIMQVLAVESSFEVLALSLRPILSKVFVLVLVLEAKVLVVVLDTQVFVLVLVLEAKVLVLVLVPVTEGRVNITAKTILWK